MQPENIHLDNPLTSREEVLRLVNEMLNAVAPYFKNDASRIDLANFTAHYGQQVASMETFSRLLWGVTPLLAGGSEPQHFSFYLQAIKTAPIRSMPITGAKSRLTINALSRWRLTDYCWRWRAKPYWRTSLLRKKRTYGAG